MSEAHQSERKDEAEVSSIPCRTLEELMALVPHDAVTPIVLYGDGDLREQRSEAIAERLRSRGIKNPLIFYAPSRTIAPAERVQFLDAGGDAVVDRQDVGPRAEDPHKDAILSRQIRNLSLSAGRRAEARKLTEYEYGIVHDPGRAQFSINGKPLSLTAYEYKILASFFMLRGDAPAGTRVPTVALTEKLYEDTFTDRHSNALGVLIRNINKELKPHGLRLRGASGPAALGYAIVRINA